MDRKDYIWNKFHNAMGQTDLNEYPTHFIFYHQLSKRQIKSITSNMKGIFNLAFETWHKVRPQNMKPLDQYSKFEILNQIVYLNPLIAQNNNTIPIHKTYKSWATIKDLWDEEEDGEYPGGDIIPGYKLQMIFQQTN